jgi:hypothetical protein
MKEEKGVGVDSYENVILELSNETAFNKRLLDCGKYF